MIQKIGIIVQGPNDEGFLLGLRDRLGCHAEFVGSRNRGKNKISVRRDARKNWLFFQQKNVDLVIRLTDSDADRWQDVKREETRSFPEEMRSLLVCGVAEGTVEMWMSLDRSYLEQQLGIAESEVISREHIVGRIKSALRRHRSGLPYDQVVSNLVRQAPFKEWLKNPSLRAFYEDCKNAALREGDCPVNDDLLG